MRAVSLNKTERHGGANLDAVLERSAEPRVLFSVSNKLRFNLAVRRGYRYVADLQGMIFTYPRHKASRRRG